ncbi:hypothetical protein N7462_002461 [Penicillium macrosclerotiorum]|uniref:uncharacterized protein n=1 Tax=Penicillium macrosclerotiorum TaxID=303699 RepID=UPI002548068C|nr:uncharacterized protein N7462_002461 [Penicillium macrosclerotiorum]KAJ5693038.1 hypothetical protein N7462_002461 [Penicillium macrosclerotiorum]
MWSGYGPGLFLYDCSSGPGKMKFLSQSNLKNFSRTIYQPSPNIKKPITKLITRLHKSRRTATPEPRFGVAYFVIENEHEPHTYCVEGPGLVYHVVSGRLKEVSVSLFHGPDAQWPHIGGCAPGPYSSTITIRFSKHEQADHQTKTIFTYPETNVEMDKWDHAFTMPIDDSTRSFVWKKSHSGWNRELELWDNTSLAGELVAYFEGGQPKCTESLHANPSGGIQESCTEGKCENKLYILNKYKYHTALRLVALMTYFAAQNLLCIVKRQQEEYERGIKAGNGLMSTINEHDVFG